VQKHAETKIKLPTSLFHQDHDKSVAENWNLNLASRNLFDFQVKSRLCQSVHVIHRAAVVILCVMHFIRKCRNSSTIISIFSVKFKLSIFSVDVWHGKPRCHIIWELLFKTKFLKEM
jgi:hypothetical protein